MTTTAKEETDAIALRIMTLVMNGRAYRSVLSDIECKIFQTIWEQCGHNTTSACKKLNFKRTTVLERLKRYGIKRPGVRKRIDEEDLELGYGKKPFRQE